MSDATKGVWHASLAETKAMLPEVAEGRRVAQPIATGTMRTLLYAPRGHDPQQPHDQDEVYIIVSGSGVFQRGEERVRFGPGEALFVPAGMTHRFAEFTSDFSTWVVFYGPKGGEGGA
jgi:mannose-6-phosphate isomerase-like protein (cupin superfamily)